MSDPSEECPVSGTRLPSEIVVVDLNLLKNLKEWSITSSILNIIGATLLGGTLGQNFPLILGSVGGAIIAVGVLIEEKKFGGLLKSFKKKGVPVKCYPVKE